MSSRLPVLIAGGGIAGLTAALAFARHGVEVALFERSEEPEPAGAGVQSSPNATRLLEELGVLARLADRAVRPRDVTLKRARDLAVLAAVPLGAEAERRWGAPYLVVHRADLHAALEDAAAAARIAVRRGVEVRGFELGAADGSVALQLEGPGQAATRGGLAIAADGVWSRTRAALGLPRSRFSGALAWRATLAAASPGGERLAGLGGEGRVSAFLHPGAHLVAYPIRGGAAFNLVAVTDGDREDEGWAAERGHAGLVGALAGAAPALRALVEEAQPWSRWPVHTIDPCAPWVIGGRLALIGDAAHAMTPYAAQGAAMAIEDAVTLANSVVGAEGDQQAALQSLGSRPAPPHARGGQARCAQPPRLAGRRPRCAAP